MTVHAVVLAAGKGTRMRSKRAKVLHRAAGRSLIEWSLAALESISDITVVVGHHSEEVGSVVPEGIRLAVQNPQNGTGHATQIGIDGLEIGEGDTVLVMPGDMPLISAETIESLLGAHAASGSAATVLTAVVADPFGYGRIVRSRERVTAIVEHLDADPDIRAINEINTSVYAFNGSRLVEALEDLGSHNIHGEVYLTDVVSVLAEAGELVQALVVDERQALGVNSHGQLAVASRELCSRINEAWMAEGVSMVDPDRVYLDADVRLEPGVVLYPDVHLEGSSVIKAEARIGPGVFVEDSEVGERTVVSYSVLSSVIVGDDATIGPYAHLRPGSRLGDRSKAGSFVEIKQTSVGRGTKIPHLAYVGDATIGEGSNIGAGSITVNYDGYAKHHTLIGDRVRIGSDTKLVAPVEIGHDAVTGAGSVITKNVLPGALGVERSPQREIRGYAARRQHKADREQS